MKFPSLHTQKINRQTKCFLLVYDMTGKGGCIVMKVNGIDNSWQIVEDGIIANIIQIKKIIIIDVKAT